MVSLAMDSGFQAMPGKVSSRRRPLFEHSVRTVIAVAVLSLTALSSCSLGEKKEMTEQVVDASKRAREVGSASVVVEMAATNVTRAGVSTLQTERTTHASFSGAVDLTRSLAALSAGQADQPSPTVLFNPFEVFASRPSEDLAGPAGSAGAEARPWIAFDYRTVGKRYSGKSVASMTINPAELVALLQGTLTGSVARVGVEKLNGVSTTHYRMNLDLEKRRKILNDSQKRIHKRMFEANAISDSEVHPSHVWVSEDGLPHRIVIRFKQEPGTFDNAGERIEFELTLDIDLFSHGMPLDIKMPGPDEVARVRHLNQLVRGSVLQNQLNRGGLQ